MRAQTHLGSHLSLPPFSTTQLSISFTLSDIERKEQYLGRSPIPPPSGATLGSQSHAMQPPSTPSTPPSHPPPSTSYPFPSIHDDDDHDHATAPLLSPPDGIKSRDTSSPVEGGLSPLDETLEKIGMGRYQKSLLFSLGAVVTSLLGLLIIPRFSCPEHPLPDVFCNVEIENQGWRYMLGILGIVSISMFISRILFFRLQESAKYLVSAGRNEEAIIALQRISRINGEPRVWELEDVGDFAGG
ncbi:hypothetical protein P7C70_g165, partial [Phenoliferia sp. Uapishka_3]